MNSFAQIPKRPSSFRAYFWAALMASIHISIILSPIQIFDLRAGDSGSIPYSILSLPMLLSFVMLLRYRTGTERFVAWCALIFSAVRIMSVGCIRG